MAFYVIFVSKNSYTVPITDLTRFQDVNKLSEMSSKIEGWDFAPISINKYVKIEGDNENLNSRLGHIGYRINMHISKDDWLLAERQLKLQGMKHILARIIARDFVSFNEAKRVAQDFAKMGTSFSNYNIKVNTEALGDNTTNNNLDDLNDFEREKNLLEQVSDDVKIKARQKLLDQHEQSFASVSVSENYSKPKEVESKAQDQAENSSEHIENVSTNDEKHSEEIESKIVDGLSDDISESNLDNEKQDQADKENSIINQPPRRNRNR